MENKACLPVECSATGLKAHFRTDLFDKKLEQEFYLDLMQGRLRIKHKDRELKRFETCGYSFAAIDQRLFLVIDWNYGECDFDVSLVENNTTDCVESIHYSVTLHAEYIDSVDRIEFAVETDVQATCSYCSSLTMQSTSFFVNEEDTELSESGEGSFNSLFNCRFFTDQNRGQEIHSDDIINMGTMIYGQVDASSDVNIGLKYYLDKLTLQNDHGGLEFDVVKNGGWAKIVEAQIQSNPVMPFTESTDFKFRSFGFSDYQNQHYLSVTCSIKLCLENDENCQPANCDLTENGVTYTCPN